MPYANEHAARVRNPNDFQQDSFRRKNIAAGVDIITGKLTGEEAMIAQAYRFNVDDFTPEQAKKWLEDNKVEYISFEQATNAKVTEGHIFAYGEVIPWQDSQAEDYGCINLRGIVNQIKQNQEATKLIVHVHSPGGDVYEGFAIHDALVNSGKEVETVIEGLCASIATVIALAGDRRLMTSHSEFMIHNPWTFAIGDSEDLKKQADDLTKIENKLANFYAAKTNLVPEKLLEYMHNETFFTVDEAMQFGFVTETVNTMKQVAHYKSNNINVMKDNKEFTEKISGLEKLVKGLYNLINPKHDLIIQTVDGKDLDFGPDIETKDQIAVGAKATVDGVAASGDHTLDTGEVYKFDAGVLNEIVQAGNEDDNAELEALKAENAALKAEVETAKNQFVQFRGDADKQLKTLTDELTKFKNEFSTGDPAGQEAPAGEQAPAKRKAFKS